jgi:hypothetical protein
LKTLLYNNRILWLLMEVSAAVLCGTLLGAGARALIPRWTAR